MTEQIVETYRVIVWDLTLGDTSAVDYLVKAYDEQTAIDFAKSRYRQQYPGSLVIGKSIGKTQEEYA